MPKPNASKNTVFKTKGFGSQKLHDCFEKMIQQFASKGSPIYLPKLGMKVLRTKPFILKTIFLLAFGLGMCEGVGEESRHGIGHLDIQVGSCIGLSVCGCHDMCT